MKRYPELINQAVTKGLDPNVEMKPSDVEWIGEVPKHWKIKCLKYIVDLNMGQSPPSEEYNSDQIGTPFLQGNAEFGLHHPSPKIYCPTARKHASSGDILLSVRAPVGALNIADQEYGIGRGLCAIRPRTNQLEHRYAKYLLEVVRTELHVVATGSTYDAVTVDEVSNLTCVVPSLSEQTQIANFLDRKTEQIDELIRIKERRIKLLQEQRTALINQAVTKGLDPNVKMKPSGVEWIGEIPGHWEVKRIKYLASLISKGTTPTTIGRNILDEGEVRFIKVENIVDNQIKLKPEHYIDEETDQTLKRSQLQKNDVLFVIAGTIGKGALVRPNHLPANTNQAISFIRLHEKELPEFVYYWLQSDNIQKVVWLEVVQSAQPNLSMENLGNLYIPCPSIAEQRQIVEYITDKTQTLVQLLQQAYKQIELLKEYRQSLISEAVTGKIDVRNEV